jgi:DtxR family Mn-dependent transcriptional regulator
MIERIDEKLGHPERCPHGWPVDPDFEQEENQQLAPLSDLEAGSRATIVRLAEHDGDLLHWFYDEGLVPGRELEVRETQPAAGQITVKLNGSERAIGEKAAAGLFVKPAS